MVFIVPLRPARCYTKFSGPPYTRKEYIPGVPQPKITKYEMGNIKGDYDYVVELIVTEAGQIRHNALEAARVIANKLLSVKVGDLNYFMKIRVIPHHVLRENKMMAFAGADRLQEGMRNAFGKPIGLATRVYPGSVILEIRVKKVHLDIAKEACRRAASKLSLPSMIEIKPLKQNIPPAS